MKKVRSAILGLMLMTSGIIFSQGEANWWYFGYNAGMHFPFGPPVAVTNGLANTSEGSASIADAAGNLLFYTDGITVWNKLHLTMANGTGLLGNSSSTQAGVIIQRPGSTTIYYIFTTDAQTGPGGLRYSIVDMSLAAGNGSVTVKNTLLQNPSCEKITGVRHCNNTDVWVISHDWNSNNFRSYLVTAGGVGAPVVSSAGLVASGSNAVTIGQLKASPNGRKLGSCIWDASVNRFELFDFNNATGVVSNAILLPQFAASSGAYGCEFSPDGTKFYGTLITPGQIRQWDLCAGSNAAIAASAVLIGTSSNNFNGSLQLGPDGKIYVARLGVPWVGVINNPNTLGVGCGFVDNGVSLAGKNGSLGLPNFVPYYFKMPPPPFTFTVGAINCLTAGFNAPNSTTSSCAASGYTINAYTWNFGDPPSGAANTSTLTNPSHTYPGPGTYSVSLILNYPCGADTIKQNITIVTPSITVNTTSATCATPGSATCTAVGGGGGYTYTWTPTAQTTSVATGLGAGIYTVQVKDLSGCIVTATTNLGSNNVMTTTVTTASVTCNGASTGTAGVAVGGGSGTYNYTWTPGGQSTSTVNGLAAGIYSITAKDAISGCTVTNTLQITQPPALTLNISASSPTACAGGSITLTATNSGGTGAFAYNWTSGPATNTYVVSQASGGIYTYSASSTDANLCSSTKTISVTFITNPTVTATSATMCAGSGATLTAAGATTYTWNPGGITLATYTANPGATLPVTVIGANGSCTSTATGTITVNALPTPTAGNTGPYCPGTTIQLNGSAASTYTWSGPGGFVANSQNPTRGPATTTMSGVYTFSVVDANGCKNNTSTNVVVNTTPVIAVNNPTVCLNQTINLTSNGGTAYSWSGPQVFASALQNPSIANAQINMSGLYTVTVTSAQGCTNTAVSTVTVYPLPTPAILSNTPCVGGTLNLQGSGGAVYQWSGPGYSGPTQNPNINNVSLATGGTYTLIASAGTCSASTTAVISINPLPVPVINSNSPVCIGQAINFTGNGGVNYAWSGPGLVSNQQNPTIAVSSLGNSGNYTLTVIDANGCVKSVSQNFVVNPQPVVNATGANICENFGANLSANGGVGYSWTGPAGFVSNAQNPNIPSATMANAGQYTVVVTNANTCTNTAITSLTVNPAPTPLIQINSPICINNVLGMSASGGASYSWTGPNGFFSTAQTPTVFANTTAYSGNYNVTVTDANGCVATTAMGATVNPIPNINIAASNNIGCAPLCVTFTMSSSSTINTYNWNMGDGSTGNNTPVVQGCYGSTGVYTINASLVDNSGCANSITHTVNIYPKPVADFNYDPINPVESVDEVHFTDASYGTPISTWNWYFMNTAQYTSNIQNPKFIYADMGEYAVSLVVKSVNGCVDTVVKSIVVGEDFGVYVPNAFSPNGDGLNDLFYAKGFGIKKFEMQIFDRWGEKVFVSTDIHDSWDGTIKGKMGKEDSYTWRIKLTNVNGKAKEITGHITLIK